MMGSCSVQAFVALLFGATMLTVGQSWRLPSSARRGDLFDDTDGRLPQNFRPYHYNLEITPDIYNATPPSSFSGHVQIFFTCIEPLNEVTINYAELSLTSSVDMYLAPGNPDNVSEPLVGGWGSYAPRQFFYVYAIDPLFKDANYVIEMSFTGTIRDDGYGLYYDYYTGSDTQTKYIATTQLEEHGGRFTFPCFDEPEFKATFNVTIVRRPPLVSVSNTPLLQTIDRGDGWVADVYATTPKMALYLVAFAVGDLQKIPAGGINGYEVNVWARPEIAPQMTLAKTTAPQIQAWLDFETGVSYREPKSDHLAVPNKGGAMENWGLISYGEQYLAFNIETSPATGKDTIGSIQSHEMAHLWYGDLVTCKWWDDIWLNEGFATYYGYRPTQALGWEGSEASQVGTQQFLEDDQRNSSDRVRKTIPNVWTASYAFQGSTYPKGGAMVHMLEGILTTPTLKAGLTTYLQTFQYQSVTTDDLWQTLTEQAAIDGITNPDGSSLDVKLRMDPWLNQMGFPLVSVTRHPDGTATLVRSHFLRPPNQIMNTSSPYNYAWDVPITVVSVDSPAGAWDAAPSAWIDIGDTEVTVLGFPTDLNRWAVVNAKFSMYYRVMYDNASLAAIVSQLLQDNTAIHVESRSQVIDDAFSVARAGYFPETNAMETTRYLAAETKWGPWNTALRHLTYSDRIIHKQACWGGLQRTYILGLAIPVYERLGWTYAGTETPWQQYLRRDMISVTCSYGHAACLSEARNQYALIVPNPDANVVDPNNLPTVLCVGVYEGTEADFQLSFNQYVARQNSQIREERYAYLYGSACTNDTTLLDRLLVELETTVASRDRNSLAQYLSQREYGAQILWNYLDANWDYLPSGISRMTQLRNIALGFSTQEQLDNLLSFQSRHPPANDDEATTYTNLILDIENNIHWLETEGASLEKWLDDHQPEELVVRMVRGRTYQMPVPSMNHWRTVHESYRSEFKHL